MASLNIEEWSADQVADWISGLEESVSRYAGGLRAAGLAGHKLLTLRCDDLDYLGVRAIGHQELLLEAVDHLRNFHYEMRRECVQQLAVRVSTAGAGLARALRGGGGGGVGAAGGGGGGGALETQALADVARLVSALKPLVCWLDRWPLCSSPALAERRAALLKLGLEAATCAQRERFAEQPARAVAASAAAAAATADYIIQDVSDPCVLMPASLVCVCVRQGAKPLGFALRRAPGGHHQLAHIRFGSPAHASGQVHDNDEIVQVGEQCVVGWSGAAVERVCAGAARATGELQLRLRRRGARPPPPARPLHALLPPAPPAPPPPPAPALAARATTPRPDSSDESDALSPPASPTQLHLDHTRMYPVRPRALARRRHSVSGGSPLARRPALRIEQFWRELQQLAGGEDGPLYRRDKAVSCSTGLELSPRPRTCLGVTLPAPAPAGPPAAPAPPSPRGKLDKSHSTPAYDLDGALETGGAFAGQPIPESPSSPGGTPPAHPAHTAPHTAPRPPADAATRNDDDFDTQSDPGGVPVCAVNPALVAPPAPPRAVPPPSPPPRPAPRAVPAASLAAHAPHAPSPPTKEFPTLKAVPRSEPQHDKKEWSVARGGAARVSGGDISLPLARFSPQEPGAGGGGGGPQLPPLNLAPLSPAHAPPAPAPAPAPDPATPTQGTQGAHVPRGLFPSTKTRSLKKKNSLLAKRRSVSCRAVSGVGAAGAVWQRVRGAGGASRWAPRHLVLAHSVLLAYRHAESVRAECMVAVGGWAAGEAGEVRSRPHAFKVYHTGTAFYFAAPSRDAMLAWLALLQRATADTPTGHPHAHNKVDVSKQFSETEYSDSESDDSPPPRAAARPHKDTHKSKFGSLKKLTSRMSRSESSETVGAGAGAGAGGGAGGGSATGGGGSAASLDRKYLRFFTRHKHKEDKPSKSKSSLLGAVVGGGVGAGVGAGGAPVPTEHYRSYRRPPPDQPALRLPDPPPVKKLFAGRPHASNPNLAETSGGGGEWAGGGRRGGAGGGGGELLGFVTLEEFMLKKQEEERKQVYTNRVLMGVERSIGSGVDGAGGAAGGGGVGGGGRDKDLHRQLARIVPDVIYGELPDSAPPAPAAAPAPPARALPPAPAPAPPSPPPPAVAPRPGPKPISVTGKDGYEKIVYPSEPAPPAPAPAPAPAPPAWRDSLRRNDKVHSLGGEHTPPRLVSLLPPPPPAPPAPAPAPAPAPPTSNANNTDSVPAGGVSRLRLMFTPRPHPAPAPAPAHSPPAPSDAQGVSNGAVRRAAGGGGAGGGGGGAVHYPHLQCPPTFQPETYTLQRALRPPHPAPPAPTAPPTPPGPQPRR